MGILDNQQADSMLRLAAEQTQRHQRVQQLLQQTLNQPHTIHRANEAMVAVAQEDDHPILLVALPSGERWDVPLNAQAAGVILRGLAELGKSVDPAE